MQTSKLKEKRETKQNTFAVDLKYRFVNNIFSSRVVRVIENMNL